LKNFFRTALAAWKKRSGIDGLFITGWPGSILSVTAALIATFFAFGFWWPYWRAGDMDIWVVYNAFVLNDRLPQEYFDHPGYLTILSLAYWFKLLNGLGLLPVYSLSSLPPESDIAASSVAWMHATQAARLLSLLIGILFATSYAVLLRAFINNWRVAALAFFMLVFSGGFMMESRIVRTELIAAGFTYIALLLCLVATLPRWKNVRPLLIGLAALCATLGMQNKVQTIFVIATIPVIVWVLTERIETAASFWSERRRSIVAVSILIVVAVVAIASAAPLMWRGLQNPGMIEVRESIFRTSVPVYQLALAIGIVAGVIAYAWRFAVSRMETLATLAAISAGIALGMLALDLRFAAANVAVVMNPIERLFNFALSSHPGLVSEGSLSGGSALRQIVDGVELVLARRTFILSTSARPTVFLEWAVLAGAIFAWRRGERKVVFQVATLMMFVFLIDLVGSVRNIKLEYFLFSDPLVILAAAWLMVRVPALQSHRRIFGVVVLLGAVTVAVGMAEPVKHTFKKDVPLDFCVPHYAYTPKVEYLPFCPRP
jgi:hypothetical protein